MDQADDQTGMMKTALVGCLLGTATGDAIALPFEGISPRRIRKLGAPPLKHRLLLGHGMISDDTEHSCMVAQSLIVARGDSKAFARSLAWRLRWWFWGLPAGIGLGTLRAILKLWLGFNAEHSGVFTAGNGPMMRSAILGVYAGDNHELRRQLVRINTRITHTDPRAERAAQIVAWSAWQSSLHKRPDPQILRESCAQWIDDDPELSALIDEVIDSVEAGESASDFCKRLGMGKGVSGYCYSTLKVVLQVWMRLPDNYEQAITEIVLSGGDTDTVAAIAGGIIGSGTGVQGIPQQWLNGLWEWPRSVKWMTCLGQVLAISLVDGACRKTPVVFFPFVLIRNLFFMLLVLLHGFRRLLPPW